MDIKRGDVEKSGFIPVSSLIGRETTNKTIEYFFGTKNIENITWPISSENISIFFHFNISAFSLQTCFKHSTRAYVFPAPAPALKSKFFLQSMHEEAFVAKNKENSIVNSVLKELKPRIYNQILGTPTDYNNNSSSDVQPITLLFLLFGPLSDLSKHHFSLFPAAIYQSEFSNLHDESSVTPLDIP